MTIGELVEDMIRYRNYECWELRWRDMLADACNILDELPRGMTVQEAREWLREKRKEDA